MAFFTNLQGLTYLNWTVISYPPLNDRKNKCCTWFSFPEFLILLNGFTIQLVIKWERLETSWIPLSFSLLTPNLLPSLVDSPTQSLLNLSTTFHPNSGFHYFFKNLEYYQSLLIGLFSSLIFLQSSSFCQSDLKNKDRSCLLTKIFSFPLPLRIQFELFGLTPFCSQYWAQVLVVPASAMILAMLSPHLPPKPFKTQRRCDLQEALCDAHSPQVKCPSAVLL